MKNSMVVSQIRKELKASADKKSQEAFKRFFKEDVKLYGVSSAVVKKIAKKYLSEVKAKTKSEILGLCEKLYCSDMCEEAFIAASWSNLPKKDYKPEDFKVFERWINKYINNWAKCDSLCNHTVGDFVSMYPKFLSELKKWTRSKNRWVKRAAAVSLIVPARRGNFLKDVFEIADALLADKDDMVQKGYGWLLKEASKKHQQKVFDYVVANKVVLPRTALRYAIEKMSPNLKKAAMQR